MNNTPIANNNGNDNNTIPIISTIIPEQTISIPVNNSNQKPTIVSIINDFIHPTPNTQNTPNNSSSVVNNTISSILSNIYNLPIVSNFFHTVL